MKKKIFAICTILIIMGTLVFNCFANATYDTFNDNGDDYNPFLWSQGPNTYDVIIDRSTIRTLVPYTTNPIGIMTASGDDIYFIILDGTADLQNNVGIQNCDTIVQKYNPINSTFDILYAYSDYTIPGGDQDPKYIRISECSQPLYYSVEYDSNMQGYYEISGTYPLYVLWEDGQNVNIYDKICQVWNREQYELEERYWNDNSTGEAYNNGYNNGYTSGLNIGYNQGYTAGLETADNGSFSQLVATTIQTPVNVLRSILNFEFLGVNLFAVFTSLLTIALFIAVIKTVI